MFFYVFISKCMLFTTAESAVHSNGDNDDDNNDDCENDCDIDNDSEQWRIQGAWPPAGGLAIEVLVHLTSFMSL